jgi:hypothetical protein
VTARVRSERVARNDDDLVDERVGDLVDDVLQHGESQRQDDSIGAPSEASRLPAAATEAPPISVASARADSASLLASRRASPPEASRRAMADPIPPAPMIAVVMTKAYCALVRGRILGLGFGRARLLGNSILKSASGCESYRDSCLMVFAVLFTRGGQQLIIARTNDARDC